MIARHTDGSVTYHRVGENLNGVALAAVAFDNDDFSNEHCAEWLREVVVPRMSPLIERQPCYVVGWAG